MQGIRGCSLKNFRYNCAALKTFDHFTPEIGMETATSNGPGRPLSEMLLHDVGEPALRAIMTVVAWNHVHALENAESQYSPQVGRARCGLLRWMHIDSDMLDLVQNRYPGVSVDWASNESNGGMHIEVLAGDSLIHLVHDPDPEVMVPKSEYGQTAASTNTDWLFPELAPQPASSAKYCAVLFHSRSDVGAMPSNLEIRFPDGNGGYAAGHLRLYNLFPDLQNSDAIDREYDQLRHVGRVPEERVDDAAHPVVRPQEQIES